LSSGELPQVLAQFFFIHFASFPVHSALASLQTEVGATSLLLDGIGHLSHVFLQLSTYDLNHALEQYYLYDGHQLYLSTQVELESIVSTIPIFKLSISEIILLIFL
jgi:hypothetical protein